MIDYPGDHANQEAVPFFTEDSTQETEEDTTDENEEDNIVILGKGKKENLEFEWTTGLWSKCSETCGGNGIQQRKVNCIVR